MIVYLANKTRFREDILSNRIEEIVHESFKGVLGKSVGASEIASWKNSRQHMDTVLEDAGIHHNPEYSLSLSSSAFLGDLCALAVNNSFLSQKSRISNLFVGSGASTATPSNTVQGLIVDVAHRLKEKSGLFSNLGENQIKELIDPSTFTVSSTVDGGKKPSRIVETSGNEPSNLATESVELPFDLLAA